ncbi:TonB-dependent receptor [Sphingosinicella terrae]|uniref:TonB-dependent receptor n=1 Tax=Sphingosinicella terrae TaxID=2172047 RepID=UPI00254988DE|nr:TonB-dependent receptor [Sphingosinicella terrae]
MVTGLLGSSALACAAPASAQQDGSAANGVSQDIFVTAQRRSENLQDVPISVQALGNELLEQQNVSSFDDYAALLPGVSFQSYGPGQTQLNFRGVTSGGDGLHGGSLPTASLYLDEIPVTTIAGAVDLHIYDIDRIEALSGPQGTLFGASSLSGTLRIITNRPDPDGFEGGMDLQLNKYGVGDFGGSVEAFANVPISANAAIRLVGFYRREGGYIDNVPGTRTYTLGDLDPDTNLTIDNSGLVEEDFNSAETYGGRIALGIDLDESWTVTPSLVYQHQETSGPFLFDPAVGDLEVTNFLPTRNLDRWFQAALTIEGRIGNWDVVYAGGYFERKVDNLADYSYYSVFYDQFAGYYYTYFQDADGNFLDPTQRQVLFDKYTKLTQEFRINSPAENRLRLTAGIFYQRQTDRIEADYVIPGLGAIPDSPVVPGTVDSLFLTRALRVDRDYAMYGQVSYDISESLTLTGGLRAFIADNSNVGFSGYASDVESPLCLPTDVEGRPCNNYDRRVNESGVTHRLNLSWDIDEDRMVYATWSTGYRPGGTNRRPGILPYDADTLTNYELGWRTSWLNRRLRLNGAVFYDIWKDLQYGLSPVGSSGITNIYNAGDAEIYGLEIDFSWLVTDRFTLSGAATYVHAELTTDFCQFDEIGNSVCLPGVEPAARAGDRLPIQPRFKTNVNARYEVPVGTVDGYVQAGLLYQSGTRSYLTAVEAEALGPTEGFATVDLAIGGEVRDWTFEAFIQNAFDERGQLSRNTVCTVPACFTRPLIYSTRPQFFGVRIGRRF